MGDVFGAVGGIISGNNTENAIQEATNWQTKAISQAENNVTQNMDPAQVNQVAQQQAASTARASLGLQQQLDPSLYGTRYTSEAGMAGAVGDINNPLSQEGQVQATATAGALNQPGGLSTGMQDMLDAAHKELQAGATLPADLQAELIQSGLQVGGQAMPGGGARGTGAGGTILSTVLGQAGQQLQFQRQQSASNLLQSASALNTARQNILSNLFPNLKNAQLSNLSANAGAFGVSNAAMPTSGISGSDAANIWLNRIGAQNDLSLQRAQVAATGKLGTAQAQNEQTANWMNLASTVSGQNLANGVLNYALGSNFGGVSGGGGKGAGGSGITSMLALL